MPKRSLTAESDAPAAHRADKRKSKLGAVPVTPPDPSRHGWLRIRGARHNNLKNVTVDLPLSRFVCVTGVSGSGKSSLINDILGPVLGRKLNGETVTEVGVHDGIDGVEQLDKAIVIDQSPIGRTPRSNPATYIKLFDEIRKLYHQLPDSQVRGYQPGRFSFNVPTDSGGGRCEACEGNGATRIEMDFLADVWVTCPVCNGRRFNFETLQVLFKGKSIFDVLDMDVQQGLAHFEAIPKVRTMLQTLHDVGLDYVKLGQSSTTLSGGEAQRIKLARELVRQSTGQTLYLLDEPTTGLHFEDIRRLLAVLHGFVDAGNTVVCIEHNLDVIKTADWIIDMGPEGGAGGGCVVAVGTPEEIARVEASHTGMALREVLPANGEYQIANSEKKRKKEDSSNPQSAIRNSQLKDSIVVVGAKEHNLKDLTVNIPRGAMTVCSGVSGSGKTSFAIDTVYTEGQRRYVESLSSYARQFLGQLAKPKVDHVYGLSPAIAIEQKTASKSPRSTVGTITEIYDYMRVLWARVGQPYCPKCDIPIGTQTSDEIVSKLMSLAEGTKVMLAAPIERGPAESWDAVLIRCKAGGYARVRVDGKVHELGEELNIDSRRQHAVELVVDRVIIKAAGRARIAESVEHSLAVGKGVMTAIVVGAEENANAAEQVIRFSQHLACSKCASSYESLSPHHFSFNARLGWCPACEGLGVQRGTSPDTVLVRPHMSILSGAVAGWEHARNEPLLKAMLVALAGAIGFDANAPVSTLTPSQRRGLLFGLGERWIAVESKAAPGMRFQWKGFFPAIDEAVKMSWQYRGRMEDIVAEVDCQTCGGGRIRADAAAVRVSDKALVDVCAMPLDAALSFFRSLKLDTRNKKIAADLLREITSRMEFLNEVGLEYLTLNRAAPTLSGGEAQRIRLASQIGSGLTGVLYVLDEPTIGLHPRDNQRLIAALHRLRNLGNTLLMVEHDREVIAASDHVIDFGPGAGTFGGHIVGADAPAKLSRHADSLTGKYLSGDAAIAVPTNRRPVEWGEAVPKDAECDPPALIIRDARQHNLKGIDVAIPLGRFVCVTGVSGSGKSSLITDILRPALEVRIHRARAAIGLHDRIDGVDHVDKIISVDQQPIGNSPLSNPATYTGIFDLVREHFAKLPDSKVRGFTANRFSFNRPGGRCEACEGQGQVCHEMHFLPDVWTTCETCNGARYNAETLMALFKGKSIADVLNMSASEAIELFASAPKIRKLLQTLIDVGLGYLPLGQSAATLSGGEAQRVKLAAELARPNTGRTLYVLDEPTTGLHFDDLRKLLDVLHRLVDLGNTVVCIEHNLDVIKTADWIIDMGPEAGEGGGTVVAAGTPEAIANSEYRIATSERKARKSKNSQAKANSQFAIRYSTLSSHTGRILADVLSAGPHAERPCFDPKAAAAAALKEDKARAVAAQSEANVKMPWERDGKRWHTTDRVSREGLKIEWDGKALSFIVETIEKLGGERLLPTDWNDRSRVEIKARAPEGIAQGDLSWYCHILTGAQWLLDVSFRAPRGVFKEAALQKKLGLKTLDQRDDIHAYGSYQRVRVRQANPDYDQIRIQIYDFAEINTPAFKSFLTGATAIFLKHVAKLAKNADQAAPWKTDGRSWHLSQQSIHHKHVRQWKPTTLVELIGRMTKCLPGLTVDWTNKVTVPLNDKTGRRIGTLVTNRGEGLFAQIAIPRGRISPTQIAGLGKDCDVITREEGTFVEFTTQSIDQVDTATLNMVMKAAAELK